MSAPPCFLRVKVVEEERTKCRIWLPLFILWPLLAALVLLALAVALFVDGVAILMRQKPAYTRLVAGVLEVLWASRGVEVTVHDKQHTVAVTVN
jgi:hypothetical protein